MRGVGFFIPWKRKLGTTPVSRAGGISHETFSIYHAGLRNVTGIGRVLSSCSRIRNCPKRFWRADCAPIVERQTIFGGLASKRAERKAEIAARHSRKSGDGSK